MATVSPEVSQAWTWTACGTIPSNPSPVTAAAFAPDGSSLALGFADGRVALNGIPYVPLAPARQLRPAGATATLSLAFSPDSRLLAEVSAAQVVLRRTADGTAAAVLDGCSADTVRFSKTGHYLVGYNWHAKAEACIFSTTDGRLLGRIPTATSAAFRTSEGDGDTTVVAAGCDAQAAVLCTYDRAGHEIGRTPLDVTWGGGGEISPLGDVVVSSLRRTPSSGERVGAFDAGSGALQWTLPGFFLERPTFTPGGDLLFFSLPGGTHNLIRLTDGQVSDPLAPEVGSGDAIRALSPGARLVFHGDDAFSALVEANTGAIQRVVFGGAFQVPWQSLAISGDGHLLVGVSSGTTFAWRLASEFGESEGAWRRSTASFDVDISPDGRLVGASGDERVVLDATNGLAKWVAPFDIPADLDNVCFYAHTRFSPDGRFLVGKGHRWTIDVFETATFTQVAEIPTRNCAGGLAFSRDGRLIATSDPALFGTGDWKPLSQQPARPPGLPPEDNAESSATISKIELASDGGILLTWCEGGGSPCRTFWKKDADWTPLPAALDAMRPRFSDEGHWVVGGATLLHLPTGTVRSYFPDAQVSKYPAAQVATFAPNGDIIAGDEKGNITRYCRHP